MNNIVERAIEMDQFGNNLPDIEQGGGDSSQRDLGRHRRRTVGFLEHPADR